MADQAESGQVDPLWRAAIDVAPDLMCIRDADGRFVAVNRAFAQLVQLPATDIVGRTVRELWPRPTADRMDRHDAEVRERRAGVTYVNIFGSDEDAVELLVTTELLRSGAHDGLLFSVARNLTALQDLDVAIHDREFVFRDLFDKVGDGIFITDLETMRFRAFNTAAHESLGYTRAEMAAMSVGDLQADGGHHWPAETREHLLAHGRARFSSRHRRKDGGIREVEVDLTLSEIGGRPVLIAVVHDITELQFQSQLLAEAEQLAQLGSWNLDLTTDELHWSAETHRIFETDPGSFTPDYDAFLEFVHPDDRHLLTEAYRRSVETHSPYSIEHRVLFRDGRVKFIHERGRTEYGSDGLPLRSIGTAQDVTELRQARDSLEKLAFEDHLTGLPNRTAARNELERMLQRGAPVAVLQLDLVEFQQINGTYGHEFGDEVLRRVGRTLARLLPAKDHLSRIGGDEFLILSPGISSEEALELANRVRAAVQLVTSGPLDVPIRLDTRVGLAVGSDPDAGTLLQHADIALHLARGAEACQLYREDMSEVMRQHMVVLSRFDQALERDQLFLEYQAQVDSDGALTGAEALVRWRTENNEVLPPGAFIPIIEGTPLVERLGVWVLDRAARQMADWRSQGLPFPSVSVNLSPRHFLTEPGISPVLLATLERYGLPRDALEVEITESVVMPLTGQIPADVERLAASGVPIAIDDFGTGYSSLSMLYRIPLHRLKIDRSLIRGVPSNTGAASIVSATIALAEALNLECLAEGVETAEELAWLRSAGFNRYQGFLFARPQPPEVFAQRWLAAPDAAIGGT